MTAFQQLQSGLRQATTNKNAANAFLQNPAGAWQSMGGTLPPGVTPAQFTQRIAGSDVHKNVVSASQGQMSVQDLSPCGACVSTVGFLLVVAGLSASVATVTLAPEAPIIAWIADALGASGPALNAFLIGNSTLTVPSVATFAICYFLRFCPA